VADPFQIATAESFQNLGETPADWDKCFVLTADLDFRGGALTPIGSYDEWFTGIFDGNGHVLRNAVIDRLEDLSVGVFGSLGSGGQIRNLGVEDTTVISRFVYDDDSWSVGGLVGDNYGSMAGCHFTGTVQSETQAAGGLVGWSEGTIDDCYTVAIVHGGTFVGGLAGGASGPITRCYAAGDVRGRQWVGGLAGYSSGEITDCYATGSVDGFDWVGGLVGRSYGVIDRCHAAGSVDGGNSVGGLVGDGSTITNSYATGVVSSWDRSYDFSPGYYAGGLAGSCYTIINCYATGDVQCMQGYGWSFGGLVGAGHTISNSYARGDVRGRFVAGGLAGSCSGPITNCYATGAVTGESIVAGLVGWNEGVTTASFWDVKTSGQTIGGGGVGKTTAQMKQKTTFTNAGWDFVNTWRMPLNDYPELAWQVVTNRVPNTPVGKSPAKNAVNVPLSPLLTASALSDSDRGDTHAASQWQVDDSSLFWTPALNVLDTDAGKTTQAVPSDLLWDRQTYHWRVRYMDSKGAWSEWSVPIAFTTVSTDLSWSSVYGTPTSVGAGGTLDISRKYRISGLAPRSDFAISYRLSVNQVWGDADDVLLTQESVTAQADKTIGFHSGTLGAVVPDSIARRSYYLLARVDDGEIVNEADEGNNVRVANIVKVTDPPAPDLSWYSLSGLPGNVAIGGVLTVKRSYRISTLAVGSDFSIAYHLSANTIWGDADDVFLTQEDIAAETDKTIGLHSSTLTVAAPASTARGYYYLLAKVDAANAVHESNENNNVKSGTFMRVV
jgi:hypothetical protein